MPGMGRCADPGGHGGGGDDERDADLFVVEGRAVIDAAVFAELLAVVGGDGDDEGSAEHRARMVEHRREGGVAVPDAVVVLLLGGGAMTAKLTRRPRRDDERSASSMSFVKYRSPRFSPWYSKMWVSTMESTGQLSSQKPQKMHLVRSMS